MCSSDLEKVGFVNLKQQLTPTKDHGLQLKLDALSKKYSEHLKAYAFAYDEYIELSELSAKKTAPVGTGSAYMRELCQLADENKKIIVLETASKGWGKAGKGSDYFSQFKSTSSSDRLKRFYGRFGFVSNYDKRDYRPDLRGNMHRNPK